jgi:beta-glucosidase
MSKEMDSAEHRAYARKLGDEAMVLLKNDGTLPIKPGTKRILVVGPLADQTRPLIGNYAGQPTHIVSVMDGLKAEFPNASITYVPGTQFLRNDGNPVPDSVLDESRWKAWPEGGIQREPRGRLPSGRRRRSWRSWGAWCGSTPTGSTSICDAQRGQYQSDRNEFTRTGSRQAGGQRDWTGFITAPETGDYLIGLSTHGFGRLTLDGKAVGGGRGGGGGFNATGINSSVTKVHFEKGQKQALSVTYGSTDGHPHAQLIWARPRTRLRRRPLQRLKMLTS